MPRYRVYYTERQIKTEHYKDSLLETTRKFDGVPLVDYVSETEWEDQVDAANADAALEEFFNQRAGSMEAVRWLDDEDNPHPIVGLRYDPDASYIWMEDGKLMEYQGIDPTIAGRTVCPFCNGKGEVDGSVAEQYKEDWNARPDHLLADIEG